METPLPKEFSDRPWCLGLLQDPGYTRVSLTDHDGDLFFRKTLHTESTIRASIGLQSVSNNLSLLQPREFLMLLDVREGTTGQSGICHGGFIATLLDEVTGRLLSDHGLPYPFTVLLNVTYKQPVYAPAVILARAVMGKVEGRKMFVTATIEDENRTVCATADALFVARKESL